MPKDSPVATLPLSELEAISARFDQLSTLFAAIANVKHDHERDRLIALGADSARRFSDDIDDLYDEAVGQPSVVTEAAVSAFIHSVMLRAKL